MAANYEYWARRLNARSGDLLRGGRVRFPASAPHPRASGFSCEPIAENHGQIADWVLPCPDQSRIHVWEFGDGRFVAHRDRYDPNAGFVCMVRHVATETAVGSALLVLGVILVTGWAIRQLFRDAA